MANTNTQDPIASIRAARDATQKLASAEQALREQHAALLKERRDTESAYPTQEEVISNASRLIDKASADWQGKQASNIVRSLSGFREVRGNGDTSERTIPPRLPNFMGLGGSIEVDDLVGLFPEIVKARFSAIIKSAPVKFGLPLAARAKRLEELSRSIENIEREHSDLVDSAGQVGVALALLPSVKTRRENEARAAELKAQTDREIAADRVPIVRR